jgi:hypothetical protein
MTRYSLSPVNIRNHGPAAALVAFAYQAGPARHGVATNPDKISTFLDGNSLSLFSE